MSKKNKKECVCSNGTEATEFQITKATVSDNNISWSYTPLITMEIDSGKEKPKMNPLVPKSIHVNKAEKIVVVKWEDGIEIKVTCDSDDTFNVDAAFAQALKYKLFGGKTQFKEKWGKIISRRIRYHQNKPQVANTKPPVSKKATSKKPATKQSATKR